MADPFVGYWTHHNALVRRIVSQWMMIKRVLKAMRLLAQPATDVSPAALPMMAGYFVRRVLG